MDGKQTQTGRHGGGGENGPTKARMASKPKSQVLHVNHLQKKGKENLAQVLQVAPLMEQSEGGGYNKCEHEGGGKPFCEKGASAPT